MDPFLEWLRKHAPLLQQITKSVSAGVTPPGFGRVLDAAQQYGEDQGKFGLDLLHKAQQPHVHRTLKDQVAYNLTPEGRKEQEQGVVDAVKLAVMLGGVHSEAPALSTVERGETITAAAMRHRKTGKVFSAPVHVLAHDAAIASGLNEPMYHFDDGFLTSRGRFVDRDEAARIADAADQIKPRRRSDKYDADESLTAEDIGLRHPDDAAMDSVAVRGLDQIARAALKLPRGAKVDGRSILTGMSHPNILFDNELESKLTSKQLEGTKDGFVTMDGKFVSRKKAAKIARKSGQLYPESEEEIASLGGELHSGDYSRPKESPESAAMGRARDRLDAQLIPPRGPYVQRSLDRMSDPLSEQQAAEIFSAGKQTPFPYQARDPHAPNTDLKRIADQYVKDNNIDVRQLPKISKVPAEKGKMMADAYANLRSDPNDPEVRAAYAQFGKEVEAQAQALRDAGYSPNYDPHDPYPNSAAMLKDLREKKQIGVFKTGEGQEHPLLTNEQNDLFRWVHDTFGHGINGNQFGPKGEEHAFRDHSSMFSPLARRVMATETRGQNSWVNFGPHSHLPMPERPFAEQKAALWPEHLMGDYDEMVAPQQENWLQPHVDEVTPVSRKAAKEPLRPVAAAAIKLPDGSVHTGRSHWEALNNAIDAGALTRSPGEPSEQRKLSQAIDGFVDDQGEFLDRAQAAKRVKKLGQLPPQYNKFAKKSLASEFIQHDYAPPAQPENWLKSYVEVNEPSVLRKVEPVASTAPEQRDLPRVLGKDLNKVQDVEDIAHETFMGPQFLKWLHAGRDIPGAPNWYDSRATQQKAIDALGDTEGPIAFRDLMNFMGASTAMSRPSNNLRRASWYRGLDMAGLLDPSTLPGEKLAAPPGFGHIAQRAHRYAVADLLQRGEINPLVNPKPASFVENLSGNDRPYTNDSRMASATLQANPRTELGIANKDGEGTPRSWAYAPMERAFQRAAREYHNRGLLFDVPEGHDPTATAQAQIWAGIGGYRPGQVNTGSFNDIFNALLDRTASLWGVKPSEANKLLWEGNPFDLPLNSPLLKEAKLPKMAPEKITESSIKLPDGRVFRGHPTHAQVVLDMQRNGIDPDILDRSEAGFWTSRGRHVSREEAARIAGFSDGELDGSYLTTYQKRK